jgi:hypothetical protein
VFQAGAYVAGLLEEVVVSEEQVQQLLEEGERKRSVGTTMMNHRLVSHVQSFRFLTFLVLAARGRTRYFGW